MRWLFYLLPCLILLLPPPSLSHPATTPTSDKILINLRGGIIYWFLTPTGRLRLHLRFGIHVPHPDFTALFTTTRAPGAQIATTLFTHLQITLRQTAVADPAGGRWLATRARIRGLHAALRADDKWLVGADIETVPLAFDARGRVAQLVEDIVGYFERPDFEVLVVPGGEFFEGYQSPQPRGPLGGAGDGEEGKEEGEEDGEEGDDKGEEGGEEGDDKGARRRRVVESLRDPSCMGPRDVRRFLVSELIREAVRLEAIEC